MFKNNTQLSVIGVLISYCILSLACSATHSQSSVKTDISELPLGAYLYNESKSQSPTILNLNDTSRWDAAFYLPRDQYSRENLERIFRWYARKQSNLKEDIIVQIYCNEQEIKKVGKTYEPLNWEATYYRNSYQHSAGEIDEYYHYLIDLHNESRLHTGIWKGIDWHTPRELLKWWEAMQDNWRIKVEKYIVEATPSSYYYVYWSGDVNPQDKNDERFMSFRHPDQNLSPQPNIKFLSRKIAYLFIGWKYAVSVDRGKTWKVWDAEREYPEFECCSYDFIKEVEISPEGTGKMILNVLPQQKKKVQELYTKDFGKSWRAN